VSKRNLKSKPSNIDWAAVDAAPLADVPDEDSPELTSAEFSELRPLAEVLPELNLGKQCITIMLDEAGGRGYQTLINDTLRRALEVDSVKEALREVIREELHRT